MTEKTQLILMLCAVPWIFLIWFGGALYDTGLLMHSVMLTVVASLINGLIGRRIGESNERT